MKILVTGSAGFIGFHVCKLLLEKGHEVIGIDNINTYYDVSLKFDRLSQLGIDKEQAEHYRQKVQSTTYTTFGFTRLHLENKEAVTVLFESEKFDVVCNLAAQAGVRYSLEHPEAYVSSNIVGFLNILECCRHHRIKHLVYASSSSVYGGNKKIPFETSDTVDHPLSLYAATNMLPLKKVMN
jgi:UDP-glucuronate 4-epimerase